MYDLDLINDHLDYDVVDEDNYVNDDVVNEDNYDDDDEGDDDQWLDLTITLSLPPCILFLINNNLVWE